MTYAAANSDLGAFQDPNEFMLGIDNAIMHLGFRRRRHRCAGTPLARMALAVGLKAMFEVTANWEMNGEVEHAKLPEMGIVT